MRTNAIYVLFGLVLVTTIWQASPPLFQALGLLLEAMFLANS